MTTRLKKTLLVGADPELFVIQDNQIISAHNLIPGEKHAPYPVTGGAIQVDGVAAEFNVNPADNVEDFQTNMRTTLIALLSKVRETQPGATLLATPTATFPLKYFMSLPASARKLGCSPDYNAYTGEHNRPPNTTEPFRTGAGHVHLGWGRNLKTGSPAHIEVCCAVTKQMDASLYLLSALWDGDTKRRTLYGARGAFRPKNYGVEYRSLSNAWVADPDLHAYIFNMTKGVHKLLTQGQELWKFPFATNLLKRVDHGPIPRGTLVGFAKTLQRSWALPALPPKYANSRSIL